MRCEIDTQSDLLCWPQLNTQNSKADSFTEKMTITYLAGATAREEGKIKSGKALYRILRTDMQAPQKGSGAQRVVKPPFFSAIVAMAMIMTMEVFLAHTSALSGKDG